MSEKVAPSQEVTDFKDASYSHDEAPLTGWKYKARKLGPITFPYYASPKAQLLLVAFVCFLCPGMFNALNSLGGGGQENHVAGDDSNTALYSTFAVVGFFAGTIVNTIGAKWALAFGGLGYVVYVSAYLCYNFTASIAYLTFAGALLGVCAGVLWAAQGAIMMSYPTEQEKGRYIAYFWMIFNLGGVIGSLVPLGQNIHTTTNSTVSNGTYIGFMILTFLGAVTAFTLVDSKSVVRSDGSKVILMKHPSWKTEIIGLWQTFLSDPYILFLFPMFFASNWFYAYQFNEFNGDLFNTRTRSLNSVLYWSSQIFGALVFGFLLDLKNVKRTTRAKGAWIGLMVLTMAIWGGGFVVAKRYTREEVTAKTYVGIDWTSSNYVGYMFLYMFYGFYDAAWQTTVYWFMGAISNNSRKLANFAGFYKGIQSAGGAITWRLDGTGIPFMSMFASDWALLAGSLVVALPVMLMKIRDTVPIEEDLKFTDETIEDTQTAQPIAAVDPDNTRKV